jgi:hypothetical protein
MYTKGRHNHLLSSYAKEQEIEKKKRILQRNIPAMDAYGNGTTGYMVKHGPNAGKYLKHIKIEKNSI